jgi:ABC-type dipeptide/oligopeptide/nickel transport system ATPase component
MSRQEKPQSQGPAIDLLARLGVSVKEAKTIGIYGPSMVGKSVLASIIAREHAGDEGSVVVFGTEAHYADDDYRQLLRAFLPKHSYVNVCESTPKLYEYMGIVKRSRLEGKVALILDSLSFIAMRETAEWNMRGISEPRVIVARVAPVLYTVAAAFKQLVVEKRALGIVIMHAGSTAGAGKYRGLVDYRPSMAGRVAHSLDYLVLMEAEGSSLDSPRKLTLVASRLTPLNEGRTARFRFKENRVEEVEERGEKN